METAREYLRVLKERWILVVAGLVIGLVGAGAITLMTPSRYTATVTMYIATPSQNADVGSAYQGSLLSGQRITSYLRMITSTRLAEDVVTRLRLNESPSAVASRISATSEPFTVIISASATDTSPDRATRIANAIGDTFPLLVADVEKPADPAASPPVVARVLEPAAMPTSPVSPRPIFNLVAGGLLGLLAGFGLALLRAAFDTSVKLPQRLADAVGAANLASIPLNDNVMRSLAALDQPGSVSADAYRQLSAGLRLTDGGRWRKMIVVASSLPGEGTTTTLCNLATVIAQDGSRVLIVETDLRRPGVSNHLDLETKWGLTDVLAGRASLNQAIQPFRNLFGVLPSGPKPADPSDVLASMEIAKLLDELRRSHDVVLLDSPALLAAIDGTVLASRADGVLLVCQYGRPTRGQVQAAAARLRSVGSQILGTVLTMTPARGAEIDHYSYYAPSPRARRDWPQPPHLDTVTAPLERPSDATPSTRRFPQFGEYEPPFTGDRRRTSNNFVETVGPRYRSHPNATTND